MHTMTSREYLIVTLTIVFGIHAVDANARSWDIAVAIGRRIEFYSKNYSIAGRIEIEEADSLAGLVYDDSTDTLFVSDTSANVSVFSIKLSENNTKPLLLRNGRIIGLAFDDKTRNLFWSDGSQGLIMRMHVPLNRLPEEPVILHRIHGRNLHGIAVDSCNSHIYWVNSDKTNQCIERSNFDGSERITIIEGDLFEPLVVAIDHAEGKLYWTDDGEAVYSKIERSNLDGTERELVTRISHQQIVYMAVDRDTIYWTDRVRKSIWSVPKNRADYRPDFAPHQWFQQGNLNGIVARDNARIITDCDALAKEREMKKAAKVAELFNNLPTSTTEQSKSTTEKSKYCLNGGHAIETDATCRCKLGFTGKHCEVELCHNYCLQGSCGIDRSNGLPTCKCSGTFVGPRCAIDPCKDYCLHDGQCSIQNEKPVCKCKYSVGSRCEDLSNTTKVCEIYCAKTEPVSKNLSVIDCRCDETNKASAQMVMIKEHNEYKILIIFGVLTAVLIVIVIVLSYYVNKLRRRPYNQRENIFDAENCCNMNICETPCFEPNLSTAVPERKGIKKEDKNCLLNNMERLSW
ncbi:low-density lipoprotein receptor repeat domain-containing protein cueball [Halictus rubicundus]|uniref:low-density lipoprotein receptor repeat domain-containing protein cueball n=1 Tax=Halictus rubicundus TaxID=77578 RepID=UPI0040369A80